MWTPSCELRSVSMHHLYSHQIRATNICLDTGLQISAGSLPKNSIWCLPLEAMVPFFSPLGSSSVSFPLSFPFRSAPSASLPTSNSPRTKLTSIESWASRACASTSGCGSPARYTELPTEAGLHSRTKDGRAWCPLVVMITIATIIRLNRLRPPMSLRANNSKC